MSGSEAVTSAAGLHDPDELSLRRVLIVEDHELLAQSVGLALVAEGFDVRLSMLHGMEEVLTEADEHQPDVVLLDLDLGGHLGDGAGLIAPLRSRGAHVVVVTGTTSLHRHGLCLEQGALAVLSKSTPFLQLVQSVQEAALGRSPLRDDQRQEMLAVLRRWRVAERDRLAPFERLTPRERQVLGCLLDGLPAERIAQEWVVSEATVRTQIRGVLTKLDVSSQLAAVAAARHAGWQPEA